MIGLSCPKIKLDFEELMSKFALSCLCGWYHFFDRFFFHKIFKKGIISWWSWCRQNLFVAKFDVIILGFCQECFNVVQLCTLLTNLFFAICLSSNRIWLIDISKFDATSSNHVSSIPLSWYQNCAAHYFLCNSPTQTITSNLVVFKQIRYFSIFSYNWSN